MSGEIIVLITASSEEEAAKIGLALVEEHYAACVNIIPGIRSLFVWQGKVQNEQETLLICKSMQHLFENLAERVKVLHSYSVPEIIALPITGGAPSYLSWLRDTVSRKTE